MLTGMMFELRLAPLAIGMMFELRLAPLATGMMFELRLAPLATAWDDIRAEASIYCS